MAAAAASSSFSSSSSSSSTPTYLAESVPFWYVCRVCQSIKAYKGKSAKKSEILATLFKCLRPGTSWFPVLRLLLPAHDNLRAMYNVKEVTLAKLYTQALGLAPGSAEAHALLHYKDPKIHASAVHDVTIGDFPSVLRFVLRNRAPAESDASKAVTCAHVAKLLDELAVAQDHDAKLQIVRRVCSTFTADMQHWLARIILKDLKISMGYETILKILHKRATYVYSSTSSLSAVCECVADPRRLDEYSEVRVNNKIKPMLCARVPWQDIVPSLKGRPFIIEDKFDGERVLLHKKGKELCLITRNGVDVTDRWMYADAIREPVLRALRDVHDCIIDGELMNWDEERGRWLPFGFNRQTSRNAKAGRQQQHLCYMAFDLLLVRVTPESPSRELLSKPLVERKKTLHTVVKPVARRFELVQTREGKSTEDVMEALDDSLKRRMEGVIIKALDSPYALADRSGAWMKLKSDHVRGMHETIDALIIGGYFGEGERRSGAVSGFLLGVQNPKEPGRFFTFCKVGTGYTIPELVELRTRLNPIMEPFDLRRPPAYLMPWMPRSTDRPDMIVTDPSRSIVLELQFAELTPCDPNVFATKATVRFPRTNKIRWDKAWNEVEDLTSLRQRAEAWQGKVNKRTAASLAEQERKKRGSTQRSKRGSTKRRKPLGIVPADRPTDVSGVEVVFNVFDGREYCVMAADTRKAELETKIAQFGGQFVQNPGRHTDAIIVVHEDAFKVQSCVNKGEWDILRVVWLDACIEARALLYPYAPAHVIFTTPESTAAAAERYDQFGDSFTEPIESVEDMRALLDRVHVPAEERSQEGEDAWSQLDDSDLEALRSPMSVFRGLTLYVHHYTTLRGRPRVNDPDKGVLRFKAMSAETRRATVVDELVPSVTHVVVGADTIPNKLFDEIQACARAMRDDERTIFMHKHIVSSAWLDACIAEGELVAEGDYQPRAV